MIKKQPSVQLVAEASNGEELIALTIEHKPDVIVTDIKMPRLDGVEATKRLSKEFPNIGIIALSMFDEENLIVDMLEAGAKGYLLKNAHKDEIIEAIKTVNMAQTYYCNDTSSKLAQMIARSSFKPTLKTHKPEFSEREFAVIRYICQEMSNKVGKGDKMLYKKHLKNRICTEKPQYLYCAVDFPNNSISVN